MGMDYFEVSPEADTNGNINLVFENISKKIIEFRGKKKPKSKQKSEKPKLVYKYIHDKYPNDVSPTIEDHYLCSVNINGKEYEQKIFMSSEDEYETMLWGWISTGDKFILVFALDNYASFTSLKSLYEKITKNGKNKYPFVLVGNKCEIPEKERKVSKNEAEELAKNWEWIILKYLLKQILMVILI